MKTNDDKWLADQLDKHASGQEAELPAALHQVSSRLQQTMDHIQPRPGFANELAGRLQAQRAASAPRERRSAPATWFWRLLAGAGGLAAVAVFVLFATGLFSERNLEPSVGESQTALPPIVLRGESGMFAGVEFRLYEPLSDAGETLALYQAQVGSLPETAEAVHDLALRLGMEQPAVFRAGEGWLAEDAAGRRLAVDPALARFPITYHAPTGAPPGQPQGDGAGPASQAVTLLQNGGLLPDAYDVRERPEDSGANRTHVEIIPTLAGHPVHYGASELVVDARDGVIDARITPLHFIPRGESVLAQSPRAAFAAVLEGGSTMDAVRLQPLDLAVKTYFPSLEQAQAGQSIRLLGKVQQLEAVNGGATQLRLVQDGGEGFAITLNGAVAEEIPHDRLVEVSGSPAGSAAGGWTLTVSGWQVPPIDDQYMSCKVGVLHREARDDLVFLTDERVPYRLAGPPAVEGGQRAEVCAIFRYTPQPLPWLRMTVPPLGESVPAPGSISYPAPGGVEVQTMEVTRVVVHEEDGGPPTPPPGTVGFVTEQITEGSGAVFTQTQPLDLDRPQQASPFEPGQEVEVTGVVGGFLIIEDEKVVPHITLAIDVDGDPATAPLAYPLYGTWGLLLEVSRSNHLHVTLRATVVEAGGEFQGPSGLALRMEGGWSRTWPDQKVETFRGHYEPTTLEGREVRLLVDEATGRRFVEATPLYYARPGDALMSDPPHGDDAVWITGVVNPDPNASFGGLPILTVIKQQGGPNLPDSPDDWMLDAAMPLRAHKPSLVPSLASNTLIIDRAVLGYIYSAAPTREDGTQALQPAWLYYGQSSDGQSYFVLRAPALNGTAGGDGR